MIVRLCMSAKERKKWIIDRQPLAAELGMLPQEQLAIYELFDAGKSPWQMPKALRNRGLRNIPMRTIVSYLCNRLGWSPIGQCSFAPVKQTARGRTVCHDPLLLQLKRHHGDRVPLR